MVVDTEISPHLTMTYDTFEADVVKMVRPQFFLSFQYKVLGSKKVHVLALPDFKAHYRKNPHSDELLVKEIWKILDKADVLIGHNINAFDCKKLNARFAYWGLPAPSSYQTIDTLTLARGKFGFPGNSLAKLADYLNVPQKKLHFGIDQWIECMDGNMKTWKKEKEYGARDIEVTEQVYYRLRSYMKNHPHINPDSFELRCHACGSQDLMAKGFRYLQTGGKKRRYQCRDCGTGTCERKSVNITSNSA